MSAETKFTPAPWRLSIEPYEDDPFPGKDYFVLHVGDDTLTGITEPANARIIAKAPLLYEKLAIAATIFREYERLHLKKGTPDGDAKALRNAQYAEEIEEALHQARDAG